MTDIKYRQERINFLFILVPGAFIAGGLFVTVLSLLGESDSAQGKLIPVAFSLVFLGVGVGMLILFLKKALQGKKEVVDLRENGRQLTGEIMSIEEHVEVTHDDHGSHRSYYYTFIVQYSDPDTFTPVAAESVVTYSKYTLQNPQCQIRVKDGKVLVEKAYVEEVKNRSSLVVILVFLVFLLIAVGRMMNWF